MLRLRPAWSFGYQNEFRRDRRYLTLSGRKDGFHKEIRHLGRQLFGSHCSVRVVPLVRPIARPEKAVRHDHRRSSELEDILGKPVASDLREGKATLAVIHALERGTGADREAIRTVLADRSFDRVPHPAILEILNRHGSLAYAMDSAHAYAEAARQSIADLPDSDAKRALLWVPTFVTTRDR